MSITYPLTLPLDGVFWTTDFDLLYRQEQSRTQAGATYVKDFGQPLWQATWQSISLSPNQLDAWRARLKALEGGLKQFVAYPTSRCYPIAYPNGTGMGDTSAATIATIGSNRDTITLADMPAGYAYSVGDYVQLEDNNLHQVVDVDSGTLSVRPHIWPAQDTGDTVKVTKPSCLMTIVPGSIGTTADLATGRGTISFQGVESR